MSHDPTVLAGKGRSLFLRLYNTELAFIFSGHCRFMEALFLFFFFPRSPKEA